MKKLFSFVAVCGLFLASNAVSAQVGSKTAQATLNVNLYPIQTIEITGDKTVNLDYVTKDDYSNGVEKKMNDHLTVYSTGGFAVKVKSESENLTYTKENTSDIIEASTINLTATKGSGNSLAAANFESVVLTNADKNLITSTVGGSQLKFNVAYKGQGDNNYINKYYNVESPNVYKTTVTYTIEAQ